MPRTRTSLPSSTSELFLTDGGLETCLIFYDGFDLPCFAAYPLLATDRGREALSDYYRPYLDLAGRFGVGCILEAPTWRASRDWGRQLGDSAATLRRRNREAMALLAALRDEGRSASPVVISGCIGPRGDGYDASMRMSPAEAESYHAPQIRSLAATQADAISALTMTTSEEAIGVARAARSAGMPAVISFTVETDGRLPSGERLADAISRVDSLTDGYPAYYMVNCAHPSHFRSELSATDPALSRLRGVRANASSLSHAELDEAETLDDGDPRELGRGMAELRQHHRPLDIVGGCCGTDHRHVEEMVKASLAPQAARAAAR